MEQQINAVDYDRGSISIDNKKVKISRYEQLRKRASEFILKQKEKFKQNLKKIMKKLDKSTRIVDTSLGVVTKKVPIKKTRPIRIEGQGVDLINRRVSEINKENRKIMWGYVSNKLKEYGYSDNFAKAADKVVVAHNKNDISFAENADSLSKHNDKIEKEREKIREADQAISEAFGMTFSKKEPSVDKIQGDLDATGRFKEPLKFSDKKLEPAEISFSNKPVFETEPLRITDKSKEDKEEKKETKFSNEPVFETGPLRLTDDLMAKQSEKVAEKSGKVAETKQATNATISSDYSNPVLEGLLSELKELENATKQQLMMNEQIAEAKAEQESANSDTKEEAAQLARKAEECDRQTMEIVKKKIEEQKRKRDAAQEEGNVLKDQLSEAKKASEELRDELFKKQAALDEMIAKRDQIVQMIGEPEDTSTLEKPNTLRK